MTRSPALQRCAVAQLIRSAANDAVTGLEITLYFHQIAFGWTGLHVNPLRLAILIADHEGSLSDSVPRPD